MGINEYNPKPSLSPQKLYQNYCDSVSYGTHYWYWRHGQPQADMVRTMELMSKGPNSCGPQPTDCRLGTPTAQQAKIRGMNPEITVDRVAGRKVISATPKATFGAAYYCTPQMNWAEACAAGRTRGPVAPNGHPQRLACEQHFLQECGPIFQEAECTAPPEHCPIGFDPFVCIASDGEMYEREEAIALGIECTNQNHPSNVAAGCGTKFTDHPSWVKLGGGVIKGAWWWATAHGKGYIEASDKSGTVRTRSTFEIDQ